MYVHVRFEPSVIGFFDPLVVDDEGEGMGSQQNLSSPKARIDTHWTIFSRTRMAVPQLLQSPYPMRKIRDLHSLIPVIP